MALLERLRRALRGGEPEPRSSPWSHPERTSEAGDIADLDAEQVPGVRRAPADGARSPALPLPDAPREREAFEEEPRPERRRTRDV